MLSVTELIGRCQANDAIAWQELWNIIDRAARYRIRRLLRARRLDETQDDDVLQDLYEHMRNDYCMRLSLFRGTTHGELRAFMGKVAYRFAKKLVVKWKRARGKEEEAANYAGSPARDGPTERQIESARRELESAMPMADWRKLQLISDNPFSSTGPPGHSKASCAESRAMAKRTIRQWRLELIRKYGDRI